MGGKEGGIINELALPVTPVTSWNPGLEAALHWEAGSRDD